MNECVRYAKIYLSVQILTANNFKRFQVIYIYHFRRRRNLASSHSVTDKTRRKSLRVMIGKFVHHWEAEGKQGSSVHSQGGNTLAVN